MSAHAFIAYLRCEANLADERARSLRATAAAIEAHALQEDADHKKQKRKREPKRPKRQQTAYTMFIQENYELVKKSNPTMSSKDITSIVAKQWANVSEEDKQVWKEAIEDAAQGEIIETDAVASEEKVSPPKKKKMTKKLVQV
mmetsp:Transcript_40148/g.60260  ORF Transcript_40148/g.60260 Transcript_40148/m.60260 type:complete len:143 (-) Transcript_40148:370-798(-)